MRRKRPLERKANIVRDASLIVIASEDRYAVRQYFDFFQSTRIQFKVLETQHGDSAPKYVLERLDEYRNEFQIGEGDILWFVSDTDHWIKPSHIQNLTEVITECNQKGIRVALSNPCFNLWLLLHFADFLTAEKFNCQEVGNMLIGSLKEIDPDITFDKTRVDQLPITEDRVLLAIKQANAHPCETGEIPTTPKTAIYQILETLIERGIVGVKPPEPESQAKPKKRKK